MSALDRGARIPGRRFPAAALAVYLALPLLLAATAARALVPAQFKSVTINSSTNRAGETATWDLILRLPDTLQVDTTGITVRIAFRPSGDPVRPGFTVAGAHFVSGVNGQSPAPRALVDSVAGDPVFSGVRLYIRYKPGSPWAYTVPDTFHLFGIVNPAIAQTDSVTLDAFNMKTAPATVLPRSVPFAVHATVVSSFLVRYNAGGVPFSLGTQTVGVAIPLLVDAVDRFGNASDTSETVALTDSSGLLPAQLVALTAGRGSVPALVLTRALDTEWLQASDGRHSGRSNSFAVDAGPLDHFFFRPLPLIVIANHPFSGRIEARDAYENIAESFNAPASAIDAGGRLQPTSLQFVSGVWAGLFTVPDPVAQDSIAVFASSKLGRSGPFQVLAQSLTRLDVSLSTAASVAGTRFGITVRAVDDSGYTVHAYTSAVQLGDSTGTLVPSATGSFTAGVWADSGQITRAMVADRVYARDAQDRKWYSQPLTVGPSATARLDLSGYPTTAEVHIGFPLTVAAVDAFGNPTTGVVDSLFLDDRKHGLAPASVGRLVAGTWSGTVTVSDTTAFDVIRAAAGQYLGSSAAIQVVPPALSGFSVTGGGEVRTAGTPFAVTVQALDSRGNLMPYFTGTVLITDDAGSVTPAASGAFTAGALTLNCTVTVSGTDRIHVDDARLHTGQSGTFTVLPAAHSGFDFAVLRLQKARTPFALTVKAVDAFHNLVTTFTGPVQLSDLGGTLTPTATGVFTGGTWDGQASVTRGMAADRIVARFGNLPASQSDPIQVDAVTPVILSVSPPWLRPGAVGNMTIAGHYFDPDVGLFVQSDVAVSNLTVVGTDTLQATFLVSPSAAGGWRPITVSQYHAVAGDTTFQVATPRLRPERLGRTAVRPVTVTGIILPTGTQIDFGAGTLGSATVLPTTRVDSATIFVSVNSDAALGPRVVHATTPRGVPHQFTGFTVMPRPVITSLSPDSGSFGVQVTAHGTGFDPGSGTADSATLGGRAAGAVVTDSLTAGFAMPDSVAPGVQMASISAFGAISVGVPFLVLAPAPGDVNGDGRFTLADVAIAVDAILSRRTLTARELFGADCDGSGVLDVVDLVCMVDRAVTHAAGLPPALAAGVTGAGYATWDAPGRTLRLPEGALAVQWRAAGRVDEGGSRDGGGAQAWRVSGDGVVGVAAVPASRVVSLPAGLGGLLEVLWADSRGRVFRASLEAPPPPPRFGVLGNPQRGRLWFGVPAHAGPGVIELFDVAGRRVAAKPLGAGEAGQVSWAPAGRVPAGLYLVRFRAGDAQGRSKVIFLP